MKPMTKTNRKHGQALVETALVLPILLILLMGIIDFGLIFNHYLLISNASRDAVRNAVVGQSDIQIGTLISSMTSTLEPSDIKTTISPDDTIRKKGDPVTITIEYEHHLLTPIISAILPNPMKIKATTTMRME